MDKVKYKYVWWKTKTKKKPTLWYKAHQQLQVSGKNTSNTHNIIDDKDTYGYL